MKKKVLIFLMILFSGLVSRAQILTDSLAENIVPNSQKVWIDPTNQSLKFVRLTPNAGVSESTHLSWLTQLLNLSENYSIEFLSVETDNDGKTNYRYGFSYDDKEIFSFKYNVSCNNGNVVTANGLFFNGTVSITTPIISEQTAYQNAIQYINAQQYMWEVNGSQTRPAGVLKYYPLNGNLVLSYFYEITSTIPFDSKAIFIDASTGSIINVFENLYYDNQPNTTAVTRYNGTVTDMTTDRVSSTEYRLREYNVGVNGQMLGIETFNMNKTTAIPSQYITDFWDTDNYWNNFNTNQDEVATDIHWGIERAYNYYWNTFGRNSWDNNGMVIKSYVHMGNNVNNAYFFPNDHYLAFGDGDGINNQPFASLDIVGHEFTHGVTHFTAGFVHRSMGDNQSSAALDESFCDIMGVNLDLELHPLTANYVLGDLVSTNQALLRDISDPKHYSKPDTYIGEFMTDVFETSCHKLGMIQSYWYYLLANGGEGQNDQFNSLTDYVDMGHYYKIKGIGKDNALQIAYRDFSNYLGENADFYDSRFYSIESAVDLFGECSPEHVQTIRAWDAVGVYESEPTKHNFITVKTNQTWNGSNPNSLPDPINNNNELWINGSLSIERNISLIISNGVKLKFGTSGKIILKEGASLTLDEVTIDQLNDCVCNWQGLIIVNSGANLNLINKTTVNMPPEGKIIIERGGRMSITDSRITSNSGYPWLGIELHGNSDQIQNGAYQGRLEINDGIIENAICAVKTFKPDPSSDEDPFDPHCTGISGWSGGIVTATNATFRNNRIGVMFTAYDGGSSSYFDECTFETTDYLLDSSIPDYFVRMNSISGIQFWGCNFVNSNPDPDLLPENRGNGIYAYDATLVVTAKCPAITCTESTYIRGSINNLYYGIRDLSSGENRTTLIERQDIQDNFRGVYFGGRNYIEFVRNYIRPFAEQTTQNPQTYGIYLDQCTGYHVEANTFNSENTSQVGIGLIINNSGGEANEVYRNTFANLRYSTIAQSYNRGTNNIGLCYKCNDFSNNLYDVKISPTSSSVVSIYDGIAAYQGYYSAGNSLAPAGNLFSDLPNNGSISFHNSANSFYYFRHQYPLSYIRLTPLNCMGTGSVILTTVLNSTFSSTACPSKLDMGDGSDEDMSIMADASSEADTLLTDLEALTDGGNTDALVQTVVTSTSAQSLELRNELLTVSPYLTDTVLLASIQQEEALPNDLLRDVMVANPQSAKSDKLLENIENRQNPMPNDMWNEIMAGATVTGDKENKEAAYGFWKNEEYFRWGRINRRLLNSNPTEDSLLVLWSQSDLSEALTNIALYYLASGNAVNGIEIIDSALNTVTPGTKNWNELTALRSYIQTIASANSIVDTTMVATLDSLMRESDGLTGAISRNTLIHAGAISYNEPVLVGEEYKSTKTNRFGLKPVDKNNPELLSVYPNPASNYFNAKIGLSNREGVLTLISSTGEIVLAQKTEGAPVVTIPVNHLHSGIYLLNLTLNGETKASVKISLQ